VAVRTLPAEERPVSYLLERILNGRKYVEQNTSTEVSLGLNGSFFAFLEMNVGRIRSKSQGTNPLRPKIKFGLC